jgi:hypothetical protein
MPVRWQVQQLGFLARIFARPHLQIFLAKHLATGAPGLE